MTAHRSYLPISRLPCVTASWWEIAALASEMPRTERSERGWPKISLLPPATGCWRLLELGRPRPLRSDASVHPSALGLRIQFAGHDTIGTIPGPIMSVTISQLASITHARGSRSPPSLRQAHFRLAPNEPASSVAASHPPHHLRHPCSRGLGPKASDNSSSIVAPQTMKPRGGRMPASTRPGLPASSGTRAA